MIGGGGGLSHDENVKMKRKYHKSRHWDGFMKFLKILLDWCRWLGGRS